MDLKQYEQTKFTMAEIFRGAQVVDSKDTGLQSAARVLFAAPRIDIQGAGPRPTG